MTAGDGHLRAFADGRYRVSYRRGSPSLKMIHMRKLVPRCLCGLIAISHISVGYSADVPVPVEKAAECMLEVLRATPGVIGPVLGTTTSEGWTHPFLEYRADEALTRKNAIRFDWRPQI